MRTLTFSRVFPAHHPKKGLPTGFVEAILFQQGISINESYLHLLSKLNPSISVKFIQDFFYSLNPDNNAKHHTIRGHKKPLKVGDKFQPVVWAGKPYNKTPEGYWQIKFCEPLTVEKTFRFDYTLYGSYFVNDEHLSGLKLFKLCTNDGLTIDNFDAWFQSIKPVENATIYCWNKKIEY